MCIPPGKIPGTPLERVKVGGKFTPKNLEVETFRTQPKSPLLKTFFMFFPQLCPRIPNPHKIQQIFLFSIFLPQNFCSH
jgi:hypothetical protein